MTVIACLVDVLPHQLLLKGVAMRAMAAAAAHLALENRVGKCFQRFAAHRLVAVETDFGFCRSLQHLIAGRVADVAVSAGYFVAVMRSAMPAESNVIAVTTHAHGILFVDRCCRVRTEVENRRSFRSASQPRRMLAARSMAGFALQLSFAKWAARIAGYAVLGFKQCQRLGGIVAGDAGIGTFFAVRCVSCRVVRVLCIAGHRACQ